MTQQQAVLLREADLPRADRGNGASTHTAYKPVLWLAIDDQWYHNDPTERRDSASLP